MKEHPKSGRILKCSRLVGDRRCDRQGTAVGWRARVEQRRLAVWERKLGGVYDMVSIRVLKVSVNNNDPSKNVKVQVAVDPELTILNLGGEIDKLLKASYNINYKTARIEQLGYAVIPASTVFDQFESGAEITTFPFDNNFKNPLNFHNPKQKKGKNEEEDTFTGNKRVRGDSEEKTEEKKPPKRKPNKKKTNEKDTPESPKNTPESPKATEKKKEDTKKNEVPKQDTKKNEVPKQDTKKNEVPKQDTKKNEVPKQDTKKNEVPKQDTKKNDPKKKEKTESLPSSQEEFTKSSGKRSVNEAFTSSQDSAVAFNGDNKKKEKGKSQGKKEDVEEKKVKGKSEEKQNKARKDKDNEEESSDDVLKGNKKSNGNKKEIKIESDGEESNNQTEKDEDEDSITQGMNKKQKK